MLIPTFIGELKSPIGGEIWELAMSVFFEIMGHGIWRQIQQVTEVIILYPSLQHDYDS